MIAITVITHNRVHLLRRCFADVLGRTSDLTTEVVIWDNASTDGTRAFLESITDPRVRVVHNGENVGMNGYARGIALTRAPYLIELDDDVIEAPQDWDRTLLEALERLPTIGFLAADLAYDPNDTASNLRHNVRPHAYVPYTENGVDLLAGPTGGGCAITPRELCDRVGGFRERPGDVFWQEEAAYIAQIEKVGYRAATLANLRVWHTGGPYYAAQSLEKQAYWEHYGRKIARKNAVKRALLAIPFVPSINRRFDWFEPPVSEAEKN